VLPCRSRNEAIGTADALDEAGAWERQMGTDQPLLVGGKLVEKPQPSCESKDQKPNEGLDTLDFCKTETRNGPISKASSCASAEPTSMRVPYVPRFPG
jgi:hypothetical protein